MSDAVYEAHLRRVRMGAQRDYSIEAIPQWMCENTKLKGAPFSFLDHEFQLQILKDKAREKFIRKCSQIGISELSARVALAYCNVIDGFTVIYTLPTAKFSQTFAKTRIDPIIQASDVLKFNLNSAMDNSEVKQFGESFLHIKGTMGQVAAISVPADALIHDELDFSDPTVVSNYQSRLTHSNYKIKWKFSTPTVEGLGISAEMTGARRWFNMCRCNLCKQWFLPDYFRHVKIPNFTGELTEITKENLHLVRYRSAYVECPGCAKRLDNFPTLEREWVCENPDDSYDASGYQISPFDAPKIITPGDLVASSTKYDRYVDFINFGLGLPAEDKDSTLTKQDIDACFVINEAPKFYTHVMGIDMGLICHIMIGGVDVHGRLIIVKTERVPLQRLAERKLELCRQYRVGMTVMDTVPYVETVIRMQEKDENLFGSLYVDSKDLAPFVVKKQEEETEEGKMPVRQVRVNRNRALDSLMAFVRGGQLVMIEDENRAIVTKHLQDMKRLKDFTQHHELMYVWRKSAKGDDHFHHTLLYTWVAYKMRGVATGGIVLPGFVYKISPKVAVG